MQWSSFSRFGCVCYWGWWFTWMKVIIFLLPRCFSFFVNAPSTFNRKWCWWWIQCFIIIVLMISCHSASFASSPLAITWIRWRLHCHCQLCIRSFDCLCLDVFIVWFQRRLSASVLDFLRSAHFEFFRLWCSFCNWRQCCSCDISHIVCLDK